MPHSIVDQLGPSLEQRRAILSQGTDLVVTAGAGAGKTRTLVARYLMLLSQGMPLRSIVAITFTRKASREMRNRIREEMGRYLAREELNAEERERWLQRYAALDAARIGTIHSLCAEIVRAHPAELGVDPRFAVLEEGQTNILREQAIDEALSWAANDTRVAALFGLLGERGLRDAVERLLRSRLEAEQAFTSAGDNVLGIWRSTLQERQTGAISRLRRQSGWQEAVEILGRTKAHDPDDRMALQREAALHAVGVEYEPLDACLDRLLLLDRINLSGGRAGAWPGGRDEVQEIKGALCALRALVREAMPLLALTLTSLDEELAVAVPLLRDLYCFSLARFQELKDERNSLDFDDLEGRAISLLSDDHSACQRWRRQVRAILVDEFQDTNARQRDLVDLLNGREHKLFVVGDAKQSIYAFRGADVSVFRGLRRDIGEEGGNVHELAVTYRAHSALVAGLNALLKPVLGEEEDPGRPWAEPFAPLEAHRRNPGSAFHSPFIEMHLGIGSKSEGALDLAADALAVRLAELVEDGGCCVQDGSGSRTITYGDVAILCRASTSFGAYEDAFERAGLPFLTVAGRGFYSRPEIRDLLNMLTAIADPTDDLALVGALRSPVLGLSDAALYQLRRQQQREEPALSLWQALTTDTLAAPPDEGALLQRALGIIGGLHQRSGRTVVADVLKGFLDATDYRAALMLADESRAARNVTKLLADAHTSGITSVGAFLEYVADLRDSGAREGEALSTREGAIQIMSVHAAKGLEFPIVVIGDVGYEGRHPSSMLLDPELGVLLPCKDANNLASGAYRMGRLSAEDKERAEGARLLYVAATRASEMLIISGCISVNNRGAPCRLSGWLGRMAGANCLGMDGLVHDPADVGGRAVAHTLMLEDTPVACTLYGEGWVAAHRASLEAPEQAVEIPSCPLPLLAPVVSGEAGLEQATPDRVWQVVPHEQRLWAPGWVIGSMVHKALAAWRFPGEGFGDWAATLARSFGLVDRRQISHAVEQSGRLLVRFRRHALWDQMARAERRHHEVPYSITAGKGAKKSPESGVIDVLYGRAGAWTVVEFKTDRVRTRSELTALLNGVDYVAQIERYGRAVESILGVQPSLILCMLDYKGAILAGDPQDL